MPSTPPPRISVLTPCWNHGAAVGRAIESVLAQDGADWEIVLIDDGSTDDSGAVLEGWAARHPGHIRALRQENRGQAHARQAGLSQAHGEFIVQLDADDWLEPGMFARCLAAFERDPAAETVVGDAWRVHAVGGRERRERFNQARIVGWPEVLEYNPYGALGAIMTRRAAIERVGGLCVEGVPGCEDWDLWVRQTRAGLRFVSLGEPVACYRQAETAWSRRAEVMLEGALNVLDRAGRPDPRLEGRAAASPIDGAEVDRLANLQVFHALGLACGAGAGSAVRRALLGRCRPGPIDPDEATERFVWGWGMARGGRIPGGLGRWLMRRGIKRALANLPGEPEAAERHIPG